MVTWLLIFLTASMHWAEAREHTDDFAGGQNTRSHQYTRDQGACISAEIPVAFKMTAEICQVKPPERHCQIEWVVRDRWPHKERWVYDWRLRKCHTIRWANHCPDPKPDTNNFASECDCLMECAGWA